MLSSAPLQDSNSGPLIAELVPPAERTPAPRRGWALLIAAAPLAARLTWWWWRHRRVAGRLAPTAHSSPALFELTEVRMTKRLLGRWKVRVISTRYQPGAGPGPRSSELRSVRPWQLARLLLIGLGHIAGPAGIAARRSPPRLPPPGDPGGTGEDA